MTNKLDQVINVDISLSRKTISQQGFGTPMFLGQSMKLDRRVKTYSNITEVGEDFLESDPEYKMANAAFSQEKTLPTIAIGKKVLIGATTITSAVKDSNDEIVYTIPNHNLEAGCTIDIVGWIETEYNGSYNEFKIIDTDTIKVTPATVPTVTPATGSGSITANETWSNAVQKCYDYDNSWYAVAVTSNVDLDILSVASKIESLGLLFVFRTSDEDNLDSANVNSILYRVKALGYFRTVGIYNGDTTNHFADAAWLGRVLPTIPGSSNWAFKSLVGIESDNLLSSQSNSIFDNNGNTYEEIAGVKVTRYGKVSQGEYVDVIRGRDWLVARLQEGLFSLLAGEEKLPYNNDSTGVIIENKVRSVLNEGVNNLLIASDIDGKGKYTVSVTPLSQATQNQVSNRIYPPVNFTAVLAGSVNGITISGQLTPEVSNN